MLLKSSEQWIRPFLNLSKDKQQKELIDVKMALKSRDSQIQELLNLVEKLELQLSTQDREIPLVRQGKMLFRDR